MTDNRPLTGKQKAFIYAYLGKANFNATEAARIAGYKGDDNALGQRGHELVNNSKIRKAINEHLEASAMTAEEVLSRLADYAKADYRSYVDNDGSIDLKRLLADNKGHLIKSVRPSEDGPLVTFYSAENALNTLAKHLNLLTDKVQQTNLDVNLSDLSDDQLRRLAAGENVLSVLSDA